MFPRQLREAVAQLSGFRRGERRLGFQRQQARGNGVRRVFPPKPVLGFAAGGVRPAVEPGPVVVDVERRWRQPGLGEGDAAGQLVATGITIHMGEPKLHRGGHKRMRVIAQHDAGPERFGRQHLGVRRAVMPQLLRHARGIVQAAGGDLNKFIQHRRAKTMFRQRNAGGQIDGGENLLRRHAQQHRIVDVQRRSEIRQEPVREQLGRALAANAVAGEGRMERADLPGLAHQGRIVGETNKWQGGVARRRLFVQRLIAAGESCINAAH